MVGFQTLIFRACQVESDPNNILDMQLYDQTWMISYAMVIRWYKVKQIMIILRLGSAQIMACMGITDAMTYSPRDALNALLPRYPISELPHYWKDQNECIWIRAGHWTHLARGHYNIGSTILEGGALSIVPSTLLSAQGAKVLLLSPSRHKSVAYSSFPDGILPAVIM